MRRLPARSPMLSSGVLSPLLLAAGVAIAWQAWSAYTGAQDTACGRRDDVFLPAAAAPFPGVGVDAAPSLGKFRLAIAPRFRPVLDGMPGFDAATGDLDSPILSDRQTEIWRSAVLVNGSAEDEAGVAVGSGGITVSDRDFAVVPDLASFPDVAGAHEIHAAIKRFQLTGSVAGLPVVQVRAGTDFPELPLSAGEIRSHATDGEPDNDMPARSFFNIYVEVDLPPNPTQPLAFPGATVRNAEPLLVENPFLDSLPPRVIYMHEGPAAVAVRFAEDNGDSWSQDDVLGHLTLAGHGVCFRNTPPDVAALEAALEDHSGIPTATPVPTDTPTPPPTSTPSPTPEPTNTATPTPTATPRSLYLPLALPEVCDSGARSLNVALVVDTSSSMTGDAIAAAREGALALVSILGRFDRVALVTFHGEARLALGLTSSWPQIDSAIRALEVTGTGTAIDAALRVATDELVAARALSSNEPVLVLMTDGRQSGGPATALEAAATARGAGILVYTIGLGPAVDAATLRAIAGAEERYIASPTPEELQQVFRELGWSLICPGRRFWPLSP